MTQRCLILILLSLSLVLSAEGWAAEPILARSSFWVPPARMAEFEAAYEKKVVPILRKHGFVESSERGRPTPEEVFSRLFPFQTLTEMEEKWGRVWKDVAFQAILQELGTTFGTTRTDGRIRSEFGAYVVLAGPGKVVSAGGGEKIPAGRGQGHWRTFGVPDGLSGLDVRGIIQDRAGNLWFGTTGSGVSRYDGRTFTTFTTKDGLAHDDVRSMFQDDAGHFWFGTGGGVSRYDGRVFATFTTKDGLANNRVLSMFQDDAGHFWFGTLGGVSRYDGGTFTTFTTKDGLGGNSVVSIYQDGAGDLWFGTWGSGVSRYDGQTFTTFTTVLDKTGHLWFGTDGGVVIRYDGQVFMTLTRQAGLPGNSVRPMLLDQDGSIWIGTLGGGVTRYRQPPFEPPGVSIDAVVANRRYEGGRGAVALPTLMVSSGGALVAFEFHGRSFKTRPEGMVYRYRLRGYDEDWKNTNARRVEYQNLPKGSYTFEVLAVDRDLVYSEKPATVGLKIVPPWYLNGWIVIPSGGAILALMVGVIIFGARYYAQRRESQQLREQLVEQERRDRQKLQESYDELQETHNELQRTQAQLIQSEKMAGLGTMVAGVAHEINNPINFVYANMPILDGYLNDLKELMQAYDEGASKEDIEDLKADIDLDFLLGDLDTLIGNCKEGAERVRQIVIDLRQFSRQDEEEKQEADIHEGIESTLTIVHNRLKNRVVVHKEFGDLPKIPCYPGQLNQVILNLLTNAADAIEGEGDVWIKTWVDGNDVKISVRDNGVGIPADTLPKIFDPFMTTKPVGSGTGLGLAVSHQIIERHGGAIEVESEVGVGTTFTILIPIA